MCMLGYLHGAGAKTLNRWEAVAQSGLRGGMREKDRSTRTAMHGLAVVEPGMVKGPA